MILWDVNTCAVLLLNKSLCMVRIGAIERDFEGLGFRTWHEGGLGNLSMRSKIYAWRIDGDIGNVMEMVRVT